MSYLNIADFKFGMDRRRPRVAGIPGTLWTLKNAFISRGGDIVRAKKFVSKYTLPAGTFGLAAIKSQPYVFGSAAAPTVPLGMQYQRLESPTSATMVRLVDAKPVDGKMYAIAQYDDGGIHHFYDGTRITGWDSLTASSFKYVAEHLALKISADTSVTAEAFGADIKITARTAGTPFTCTATATDTDSDASAPTATRTADTANVVAVPETRATGSVTITGGTAGAANKITQVTVGGVGLLASGVDVAWTTSNNVTANALAVKINNHTAVSGWSATSPGATVVLRAAVGTGATKNGLAVVVAKTGNVTTSHANTSGGITAIAAVQQVDKVTIAGGVFDLTDTWSVTVNGVTYLGTGLAGDAGMSILVHKKRVWSTAKSLLRYCKLNTFTDWTTTTVPSIDAGFINISTDTDGSQDLVGCGRYNGLVAIFSHDNIIIYTLDTDADNNEFQQVLENTGTDAPGSIVSYGNTDVFYLEQTGIRSVRSRDGYNAGYVSDVGSAIDSFVQAAILAAGAETVAKAQAVIDINDGRYLLALGSQIIALSYFPSSKITAWSYIEPGFAIDALIRAGRQIFARSGDTVYLYGGDNNDTFPDAGEQIVSVETPFMSANDPAGIKLLEGVDIACTNDWQMDILVDPNDTSLSVSAGTLNGISYSKESQVKIPGATSHVAFVLTCAAAGDATLSSVAIHFEKLLAG